jgi:hypothetical protein
MQTKGQTEKRAFVEPHHRWLIKQLKNSCTISCLKAVRDLGMSRVSAALPKLTKMLSDPDPLIREEVKKAIDNINSGISSGSEERTQQELRESQTG